MLTKQAQEEVYNAYYSQGVELALGQVKVAGKTKEVIKKILQLPALTVGGVLANKALPTDVVNSLADSDSIPLNVLANYLTAAGTGAGAIGAYKGTGKAVDLADAGIQKLIKKMKR
tara:strand:+ start:12259 stop:12606 length:348 start_codon:yes stop_codon:yes gene_type:complete